MNKDLKEKLSRISAKATPLKTKNGMIELDPNNPDHIDWYNDDSIDWEQEEKFAEELMEVSNEAFEIEFENGSKIKCIKSKDSIRGKGWHIGIDLAKENDYTALECPQCYNIISFQSSIEHFNCPECGYKIF